MSDNIVYRAAHGFARICQQQVDINKQPHLFTPFLFLFNFLIFFVKSSYNTRWVNPVDDFLAPCKIRIFTYYDIVKYSSMKFILALNAFGMLSPFKKQHICQTSLFNGITSVFRCFRTLVKNTTKDSPSLLTTICYVMPSVACRLSHVMCHLSSVTFH